jgi:hypothetical protein
VPRHVARLVAPLVADNFAYVVRPGASVRRGSLSTSSPTSRVRVPQHVARLIVDNVASRRLVVDYFVYAARPGASARRAARHVACC